MSLAKTAVLASIDSGRPGVRGPASKGPPIPIPLSEVIGSRV
jgi:hypothetical protein